MTEMVGGARPGSVGRRSAPIERGSGGWPLAGWPPPARVVCPATAFAAPDAAANYPGVSVTVRPSETRSTAFATPGLGGAAVASVGMNLPADRHVGRDRGAARARARTGSSAAPGSARGRIAEPHERLDRARRRGRRGRAASAPASTRRRRPGAGRDHHRRRDPAERGAAGRARARRHPRRRVRRRRRLHRLPVGAGDRRRADRRGPRALRRRRSAPTSCRGSPIPTDRGDRRGVRRRGRRGRAGRDRRAEPDRAGHARQRRRRRRRTSASSASRAEDPDGRPRDLQGGGRAAVARRPSRRPSRPRARARRDRPVRLPPGQRPDPLAPSASGWA